MATAAEEVKGKQPVRLPDPLGILEALSGGGIRDPYSLPALLNRGKEQSAPAAPPPRDFNGKVEQYLTHLYAAYRVAPCDGCKGYVESAITAAEVFRVMQDEGITVEQVRNDPSTIDQIKEKVKKKLANI